jgi:hypothetical protein
MSGADCTRVPDSVMVFDAEASEDGDDMLKWLKQASALAVLLMPPSSCTDCIVARTGGRYAPKRSIHVEQLVQCSGNFWSSGHRSPLALPTNAEA